MSRLESYIEQLKEEIKSLQRTILNYNKNKKCKEFIEFVKLECERNGVILDLSESYQVQTNGIDVSGFFDEKAKKLAVATLKEDYIAILVHEYCHMLQWECGTRAWNETYYEFCSGIDVHTVFDLWLNAQVELNANQLTNVINRIMECELECEAMTVELAQKWNLPINLSEYRQKSNAYAASHVEMSIRRQFITGLPKQFYSQFPKGKICSVSELRKIAAAVQGSADCFRSGQ